MKKIMIFVNRTGMHFLIGFLASFFLIADSRAAVVIDSRVNAMAALKGVWKAQENLDGKYAFSAHMHEFLTFNGHEVIRSVMLGQHNVSQTLHYQVVSADRLRLSYQDGRSEFAQYELKGDLFKICHESVCGSFARVTTAPELRSGKHEIPHVGLAVTWQHGQNTGAGTLDDSQAIFPDDFNVLSPDSVVIPIADFESGYTVVASTSVVLIEADEREASSYGISIQYYAVKGEIVQALGAPSRVELLNPGEVIKHHLDDPTYGKFDISIVPGRLDSLQLRATQGSK